MCGLCVSRCPAELVKHNAALLSRRIYGRNIAPKSQHLSRRREEVKAGKFSAGLAGLKRQSKDELKKRYAERDIEPGE